MMRWRRLSKLWAPPISFSARPCYRRITDPMGCVECGSRRFLHFGLLESVYNVSVYQPRSLPLEVLETDVDIAHLMPGCKRAQRVINRLIVYQHQSWNSAICRLHRQKAGCGALASAKHSVPQSSPQRSTARSPGGLSAALKLTPPRFLPSVNPKIRCETTGPQRLDWGKLPFCLSSADAICVPLGPW